MGTCNIPSYISSGPTIARRSYHHIAHSNVLEATERHRQSDVDVVCDFDRGPMKSTHKGPVFQDRTPPPPPRVF